MAKKRKVPGIIVRLSAAFDSVTFLNNKGEPETTIDRSKMPNSKKYALARNIAEEYGKGRRDWTRNTA